MNYEENIPGSKIIIFIFVLSLFVYFLNIRPVLANKSANLGLIQLQRSYQYTNKYIEKGDIEYLEAAKNSFANGIAYLEKAIDYNTYQNTEFREGYSEAVLAIPLESLFAESEIESALDNLSAELNESIKNNQRNARILLQVMSICNTAVKYNPKYISLAEELGEKVLLIDSFHPQTYYELGKNKFYQEKYDEGISCLKKAIELNPTNITSHWNLAIAYIKIGKIKEARAEIKIMEDLEYLADTPEQIQKWIGIYEQVENIPKIVELYDKMIELSPTAGCYVQAAIYNQKAGNKGKAKKYALKAAEINKDLEDEVANFIKEL